MPLDAWIITRDAWIYHVARDICESLPLDAWIITRDAWICHVARDICESLPLDAWIITRDSRRVHFSHENDTTRHDTTGDKGRSKFKKYVLCAFLERQNVF